jgi:hypothetical protein
MVFEEQLAQISSKIPSMSGMMLWGFAGLFVVAIIWYVVYYFSFNRTIIIKERVGKEFEFDTSTRLFADTKEKANSALKSLAESLGAIKQESPQTVKKTAIKAIPTVTMARRGKVVNKGGKYHIALFRFLNKSLKIKVVGSEFWNLSGNKRRLELMKLSEHVYAPMVTVYDDSVYSKAIFDETFVDWVINDIEEDKRKFQNISFWERYGVWIMTAMTFVLCLIFVIVVFKNLQPFAEAGKSGAEALANACIVTMQQNVP